MEYQVKTATIPANNDGMTSIAVLNVVNQSQRAMYKLLHVCLSHNGLTVTQWMLLGSLVESPKTPTELARLLSMKTPYVSLTLRQLRQEMSQYIVETSSEYDIRSKQIALTGEGKKFVQDVESKLQMCLQRELVQKVAPIDLQTYFSVTSFIADNVKHLDEQSTS